MSTPTIAKPIPLLVGASLFLAAALSGSATARQAKKPAEGEAMFAKRCASCHGAKGQGGAAFSKPLRGTKSVSELAAFIGKNMPPGTGTPAPQAKLIAEFMHGEFYSPIAQERNRPARVELSRLTVRQFQNAVSDLVTGFHPSVPNGASQGLNARYYNSRHFDDKQIVLKRVDPSVKFDFGVATPDPKLTNPYRFSILWEGSLVAPDTGEYEFVVRTDHAVRLYLNDPAKPLIDAWVKSGTDNEFRGTAFLLGGRAYPVRLDFSKANQGVDDEKREKEKPPAAATIEFLWKRPKLALEPVPARNLTAAWSPPKFVLTNPFPSDDRSMGYERGTAVSKEWDEATTAAAIQAANFMADSLPANADAKAAREKGKEFVERAFRRPLTPELEKLYLDRQLEGVAPAVGLKRIVLLALKSPRFLYREPAGKDDAFAAATEMSLALWDTLPDQELWNAAKSGELVKPEVRRKQAERLAADARAKHKLREYLLAWLKVDEVPDLVKSPKRYPAFDEHAATDLRNSFELFLEERAGDYTSLMLSEEYPINGRLAPLYGVQLAKDAPFQPVKLDAGKRAGVLTHPYMLSKLAYLETSSPIHRGVLIARSLLGRTLQAPPAAFTPLAASLHPKLTTRERVAMQTKPPMCASCHTLINPLGFSLEKFDAIGKMRDQENGKKVDSSGHYETKGGSVVKFTGAKDLANYLANSPEAHQAFVEKMFHHFVKQPVRGYGAEVPSKLGASFKNSGYSIRSLMVEVADVAARGVQ